MAAQEFDISGVAFFLPLISFFLVFAFLYALLNKAKLFGDDTKGANVFVSFLFATIFITSISARGYLVNVIPWFVILALSMILILILVAFSGKPFDKFENTLGTIFVVLLAIVFVVSAVFVFSSTLASYLPGTGDHSGANPEMLKIMDWLFNSRVGAGLLLLALSALVSWILMRNPSK